MQLHRQFFTIQRITVFLSWHFRIFFPPYNALNSASLHQGILQQLASCRQSLTALCSLNIKQHSDLFLPFLCLNSLYIGRLSSSEEEWAKSRTQNCVFRYPDLCISTVVVLASELWDFYISTGSLDEKSFNFFPLSFFLGLSGDTSKRKAVIADRVSH